jgi:AGZA family xanthine/uracil permease-like MFS transporter
LDLPVSDWIGYVSVIVPMGLFNVMGSLQNIESAEAAGDRYHTGASLGANGVGTIAAACFGSCFPTTIYIGHPGWKGLGARAGYSTLNGLAVTSICLTGTVTLIQSLVPIEAGIAIVLWIGVVITAQAFQATPREHAPAVAIGLFPSIAAWGATIVQGSFRVSGGATLQDALTKVEPPVLNGLATEVNGFLIHAMIVLERGYIFTCVILAAMAAHLIDRRFLGAGCWSLVGAACAGLGLTHAYRLNGNTIDFLFSVGPLSGADAATGASLTYHAWPIAAGYILSAGMFFAFAELHRRHPTTETSGH